MQKAGLITNCALISTMFAASLCLPSVAAESQTPAGGDLLQVSCTNPHAACTESQKVIDTVKYMAALLAKGDLQTYSEYLDDGCTTFDENKHKLIVGKQAVLSDLRNQLQAISAGGRQNVLSLTIEEPYARVDGDMCVVSFKAIKEIGGAHPDKEEISATDVFVKHGDKWQKLHFRGKWKRIS